jgi:beta-glucanase (GH16 family)
MRAAAAAADQTAWRKVWSDTFAGLAGSGINSRRWQYDTGAGVFGTGEVETMTNSHANVALDGLGNLDITALEQNGSWTSGRVQTLDTFAAPAGGEMLVTAEIRQPSPAGGLGYWAAFWMLGAGGWPQNGEIDIMEDVNAGSELSATAHCGNLTQPNADGTFGPCHEYVGISSGLQPCRGCQSGYHAYSLVLDRRDQSDQQLRWYLDGRPYFAVSEAQIGAPAWTQAYDHGLSVLLDVAIGGAYPDAICGCAGPTAQTTSGGTMSVRGVAVYYSGQPGSWPFPLRSGW